MSPENRVVVRDPLASSDDAWIVRHGRQSLRFGRREQALSWASEQAWLAWHSRSVPTRVLVLDRRGDWQAEIIHGSDRNDDWPLDGRSAAEWRMSHVLRPAAR